ncbi:ANR10-like protein [Mya arenaria]|uniref:ANR10-like protein n=1 Tax=Mya arenaria TaxID=6604 RepID=A0ABY7G0S6_MYAAR|nr:ANR10-like protein [Mya arenaria]
MHEAMAISLLEAIKKGDDETAKRILRHRLYSNIERQGPRKDGTPLFWCCCRGDFELARLLLLHGAEVNRPTAWGASPLHAAADHNQPDVILLLIEFGANVNQQTNNGDTPCHLAAYRGYKECVRNLIQNGADVSLRNSRRHTPIQEAYIRGHTEIYTYLLNVQKLENAIDRTEWNGSLAQINQRCILSKRE